MADTMEPYYHQRNAEGPTEAHFKEHVRLGGSLRAQRCCEPDVHDHIFVRLHNKFGLHVECTQIYVHDLNKPGKTIIRKMKQLP